MRIFADAHAAYWFLAHHPAAQNGSFIDVLDVAVMKINPATRAIDDDRSLNTEIEVWLESGAGPLTAYTLDCTKR